MAPLGKYLDQMAQEAHDCRHRVKNSYCNTSPGNAMMNYLYKCVDEGDRAGPGVIEFVKDCGHGNGWHCSDNGSGSNDSCKQGRWRGCWSIVEFFSRTYTLLENGCLLSNPWGHQHAIWSAFDSVLNLNNRTRSIRKLVVFYDPDFLSSLLTQH